MEPVRILETVAALLVITALGGIVMAGVRFAGRTPPIALAMLHGFLAAAAATLLLYGAAFVGLPALANYGTVLLLLAAAGGVVMNLGYHWKQQQLPMGLMLGHAAIAVLGFLLVAMATWQAVRG